MNCKDARQIFLPLEKNSATPSQKKQAREHLATCKMCQAALERLAVEVNRDEDYCAAVQEMLPIYLDAERAGKPVQADYPQIWQHLKECTYCAQAHADLQELLQTAQANRWLAASAYSDPAPSLLFSRVDRQPAYQVETIKDAWNRLLTLITLPKIYIANLLSAQTQDPAWARSSPSPNLPSTRFPLIDILLEESNLLVSLEAVREPATTAQPEHLSLQVSVTNPVVHLGQIQIRITDGLEERTALVNEQGEATFSDVPSAWLANKADDTANALKIYIEQLDR